MEKELLQKLYDCILDANSMPCQRGFGRTIQVLKQYGIELEDLVEAGVDTRIEPLTWGEQMLHSIRNT